MLGRLSQPIENILENKLPNIVEIKKGVYICVPITGNGLVVQLVRIHACHAWGREFESRPDRQQSKKPLRKKGLF